MVKFLNYLVNRIMYKSRQQKQQLPVHMYVYLGHYKFLNVAKSRLSPCASAS
jgi:hypothetical protein